ncbi:hypothetical protein N9W71_00665 [Planktomarina temperata]|nr:hypothetical protein [Planktomarina temperata]
MNYSDEMRKLIDIIKQQSFTAPLAQTLDDLNSLTTATSELSDRINIRVRKSLQPNDKKASKAAPNTTVKKAKPFLSAATPKNPQKTRVTPEPDNISNVASAQSDADRLKQSKLSTAPIKPQPPI